MLERLENPFQVNSMAKTGKGVTTRTVISHTLPAVTSIMTTEEETHLVYHQVLDPLPVEPRPQLPTLGASALAIPVLNQVNVC